MSECNRQFPVISLLLQYPQFFRLFQVCTRLLLQTLLTSDVRIKFHFRFPGWARLAVQGAWSLLDPPERREHRRQRRSSLHCRGFRLLSKRTLHPWHSRRTLDWWGGPHCEGEGALHDWRSERRKSLSRHWTFPANCERSLGKYLGARRSQLCLLAKQILLEVGHDAGSHHTKVDPACFPRLPWKFQYTTKKMG